jgi:beta-lactamase class D
MRFNILIVFISIFLLTSCAQTRIHDKEEEWGSIFKKYGINDGCFMMRDHSHEEIYYYSKERCIRRFMPASTFKIFNSLVALETAIAPDDQFVIKWDSVVRPNTAWNHDMNMREAFKVSNVPYYQELARRIGKDYMQHYIDTAQYGNRRIGSKIDEFWLNDSLQISADEQVGLIKKLYFDELPFSDRSQRIVRSMMLQEDKPEYRLYYKTGTGDYKDSTIYWVVGYAEKIEHVKEHKESMNKSDVRNYPFFFAENFSVKTTDSSQDWAAVRIHILKEILNKMEVLPPNAQ